MAKRDYYDILRVKRGASEADIRAAYRKLARKYHPDVNKAPDAAGKFKEATEAYEILSDPQKRKMYDQFGHAGPQPGPFGPGASRGHPGRTYTWTSTGGGAPDFGDLFGGGASPFMGLSLEEILDRLGGGVVGGAARGRGRPGRRAAATRGADIEYDMTLDFLSAVRGTTATLRFRGDGQQSETLSVKIPPGVREGSRIRVRGKGHQGAAGRGDLYIVTHVRDHPYFRREGRDLYVEVPIGLAEAALGASVEVPTLEGKTTIKVPPGSPSGRKLRLRGKGVPGAKGDGPGDEYVVLKVVPPKKVSNRGRELLREFEQSEAHYARKDAPWR